ncbi:hypothetical protein CHARACLAT_025386 [Characodon lateralis]|uniref:HTH-like domain-containing protein n=1 Tax=Characodon lateralis TaxID=208331 RepID=A0ABU7F608_9TELE|nr:hypothetical protein [Characodon lateralis]
MAESGLSVRALYITMSDDDLDQFVRDIKSRQPHSGYQMVKALLQARGLRVQYDRVRASMHRVDTIGMASRMVQLGCIARRTYSVPGPQSLMHIDTNHKLIRLLSLFRSLVLRLLHQQMTAEELSTTD